MEFHVEPRDDFHYARFSGLFNLPEAKTWSIEILEECCKKGMSKILMDIRGVTGNMSTAQRYEYATYLAEKNYALFRSMNLDFFQIAYVGSESFIDPEGFAETVAANRGMNIKAFTDIDEAMRWLGLNAHGLTI